MKFAILRLSVFLIFAPSMAMAVLDLKVQERLRVFAEPDTESLILSQLGRGDRVVISPKKYGSFRKVLVTVEGKKRAGYIPAKDIIHSKIEERGKPKEASRVYSQNKGAGLALNYSYLQKGAFDVATSDGFEYDISAFSSAGIFFDFFLDWNFTPTWTGQVALLMRETDYSGDAKLKFGGVSKLTVSLRESLIGIRALLKKYSSPGDWMWWGLGVELSKGNTVRLKIDGASVDTDDVDLPMYVVALGGVGWDIPITGPYFLLTQIRGLVVANADPMIFGAEVSLAGAYSF